MPKLKMKKEEPKEEKRGSLSSLMRDDDELISRNLKKADLGIGAANCGDATSQLRMRLQKSGMSSSFHVFHDNKNDKSSGGKR